MQIDLSLDELTLIDLAMDRMRAEIDVEGSKVTTMNAGQRQACRYTIKHLDRLAMRIAEKMTEAADGTGTTS